MRARAGTSAGRTRMSEPRANPASGSTQSFGYGECLAHRVPDGSRILALGQCPLDRALAKFREHVVLGKALRIGLTELRVHPVPKVGHKHTQRSCRSAKVCGIGSPGHVADVAGITA